MKTAAAETAERHENQQDGKTRSDAHAGACESDQADAKPQQDIAAARQVGKKAGWKARHPRHQSARRSERAGLGEA